VLIFDLERSTFVYQQKGSPGDNAYEPRMLVLVLLVTPTLGLSSSRQNKRKPGWKSLTSALNQNQAARQQPIADFRGQPILTPLAGFLCLRYFDNSARKRGGEPGHVALDGNQVIPLTMPAKHKA